MEDTAIPYELPEAENHSFFFIDQRVETRTEAKLHRHDAWELYYVVHGYGSRTAGDTCQPFTAGDIALISPSMLHRWEYAPESADTDGRIRYLMAAFDHSLVKRCMEAFPEVRNRLAGIPFPTDALKFGPESSRIIRKLLSEMTGMDELEQIAAEVGMNRSAFCSYFKRCKGMTFSQFVTQYRLNTACELLKHSQKQVSEICYLVGFNDVPHFNRMFKKAKRMSPKAYRNAESIKSP